MSKSIHKTICILTVVLLLAGCNLNGPGIFRTISLSTAIEDSELATENVRNILLVTGNTMYIQHGGSVKKADISVSSPSWDTVALNDGSAPVFVHEAVETGTTVVYSGSDSTTNTKTVYVDTINAATYAGNMVPQLEDVQVIGLFVEEDGSTVYACIYDAATDETVFYTILTGTPSATEVGRITTVDLDVAASSIQYIENGADDMIILTYYDSVQKDYSNYSVSLSSLSTATPINDTVFDSSDDAAKDVPVVGATAYGGDVYIVTSDGILITADSALTTFTAVNSDTGEDMGLSLSPSGSTVSRFKIPMTVCTDDGTEYLILGGTNSMYWYVIGGTSIPAELSASANVFYANLASSEIMDFYNSDSAGFSFYVATADSWVWKVVAEGTASDQLL